MLKVSATIPNTAFSIVEETLEPNPWRDALPVAAVGPNGEFKVTFLDRHLMSKGKAISQGDTPVAYSPEMGAQVSRWYKARGWALYEDLCAGNVRSVEASPEHWKVWQLVCKIYSRGQTIQRGAAEAMVAKLGLAGIYHPEVHRRRAAVADGGMFALSADDMLRAAGFEPTEAASEPDLEAMLAAEPAPKKGR